MKVAVQNGETVMVRFLPEGVSREAVVRRFQGRQVDLEIPGVATDPVPGMLLELTTPAAIYLGVIQQVVAQGPAHAVSFHIEHYLDRKAVEELQEAWRQTGSSEGAGSA
jgi:hypothetical protein